jgi:hypothetical protein
MVVSAAGGAVGITTRIYGWGTYEIGRGLRLHGGGLNLSQRGLGDRADSAG